MRQRWEQFMMGRQGMDELSKCLFWLGLLSFALAVLCASVSLRWLSRLLTPFFALFVILAFLRAFSRNRPARELENYAFLSLRARQRQQWQARKNRFSQRRNFRFYRCPGCKTMLRVPRGKGKIHIRCKCGYTLYRRT